MDEATFHELDKLQGLAAERWNQLHPENAPDVKRAAERLRFECETTEDPNSGFAKDIMTLVRFAETILDHNGAKDGREAH